MSEETTLTTVLNFSRRYRCSNCGCKGRVSKELRGPTTRCARCGQSQPANLVETERYVFTQEIL